MENKRIFKNDYRDIKIEGNKLFFNYSNNNKKILPIFLVIKFLDNPLLFSEVI